MSKFRISVLATIQATIQECLIFYFLPLHATSLYNYLLVELWTNPRAVVGVVGFFVE
jgi:hypothetical protein